MKTIRAGLSVTTTATTETDLFSNASSGLGVANCSSWGLAVTNDALSSHSVTIKVYVAFGQNSGLTLVSGLTTTLAAGASVVIERPEGFCGERIRVTSTAAGASSTTVACDFVGKELT